MPAIADKLEPLSVGTTGRSYELVEDVVIEVSTQFKLESYSAPNSAYSSPPLGSGAAAKKKVHEGGRGLNRSKSCGEGRGKALPHGLIENRVMIWEKGHKHKTEEGKARRFRCGALCLLLPVSTVLGSLGFKVGKGKEERKEEVEEGEEGGGGCISISISHSRVSLEKFECGSWASSGMVAHEDGESMTGMGSLYFDLPMELIRNSVGARTQSPAQTAFVFDRDGVGVHHLPVWTKAKLAEESGAASPCVITPRLRRAREEFNALLEAHC